MPSLQARNALHADTPIVDMSTLTLRPMTCDDDDTLGYPHAARMSDAVGVSHVLVEVAPDGRLTSLAVVGRSGRTREHDLLDVAAYRHYAVCRVPPRPEATVVRTVLPFEWKLE